MLRGASLIVDEFAPHRWIGPHAPQEWIADYDKNAKATGVTDGRVTYGKPTRTEIEGDLAYVIMPTVYLYNATRQAPGGERDKSRSCCIRSRRMEDAWIGMSGVEAASD